MKFLFGLWFNFSVINASAMIRIEKVMYMIGICIMTILNKASTSTIKTHS